MVSFWGEGVRVAGTGGERGGTVSCHNPGRVVTQGSPSPGAAAGGPSSAVGNGRELPSRSSARGEAEVGRPDGALCRPPETPADVGLLAAPADCLPIAQVPD